MSNDHQSVDGKGWQLLVEQNEWKEGDIVGIWRESRVNDIVYFLQKC